MIVKQIYADNPYRNFHYLIGCPETREALVIDPLNVESCLKMAKDEKLKITQILNTHEHWDHIGGNEAMIAATGAKLLAHHLAGDKIPGVDRGLKAGDVVKVGTSVQLTVLDTPGHTKSHVCLLSQTSPAGLFCGDTLFNAGAGNCKNGGHPEELYETFSQQLDALANDTLIYPGHDYIVNNLEFTLDREPDNSVARSMLASLKDHDPHHARITSMGDERKINTFFRLQSPGVIQALKEKVPELPQHPTARQVFIELRELRNSW